MPSAENGSIPGHRRPVISEIDSCGSSDHHTARQQVGEVQASDIAIDHRGVIGDVDFWYSVEGGDGGTDRSSNGAELDERTSPVSEPPHKSSSARCATNSSPSPRYRPN